MRIQHFVFAFLFTFLAYYLFLGTQTGAMEVGSDIENQKPDGYPTTVLAGGCFWCLESEFRALDGILYTRVGYEGGNTKNPTYEQVTTGRTGHAEAVEITYDPEKISYTELIKFFLTKAHDPTQINRQGVDVGTQYRSVIFYKGEEQKEIAKNLIKEINASGEFKNPIATEVAPDTIFWLAEDYHQQYYEKYQERTGYKHIRVTIKEQRKAANKAKDSIKNQ